MNIIASIQDKWFQLIKSGKKTIEVRKSVSTKWLKLFNTDVINIYWYNTKTKRIEGKSRLNSFNKRKESILFGYYKDAISEQNKHCIPKDELQNYLGNRKFLYFWWLGEFESIELELPQGKRPPQSWCYYDTIFHPLIAINPNFNKEH